MTNRIDGNGAGSRWRILAVLYLCQLSFAVTFQSMPPVMSLVIAHFSLSHHEAGLLMSMFSLPGIFLSLLSGMLSDRTSPDNKPSTKAPYRISDQREVRQRWSLYRSASLQL